MIDRVETRSSGVRTPVRLLTLIAVPVLCVLAFWAVLTATVGGVRGGYAAGDGSRAAVAAAGQLSYDLADMGGKAAEILLVGDGSGLPQGHAALYQAYENDEADANSRLALVGPGLDGVPGGSAAFVAVENGLDRYSQDVVEAFYLDGLDRGQAPDQPPAAALADYQSGTAIMHGSGTGLLAEADALLADEEAASNTGYDARLGTLDRMRVTAVGLTALVLLALIAAQVRLARKFHRRTNPALAACTAATVIFGVLLFSALDAALDGYGTQRADALGATAVLWRDEIDGADMKASEARWLLDLGSTTPAGFEGVSAERALFESDQGRIVTSGTARSAYSAYVADDGELQTLAADGAKSTELSAATVFYTGQIDRDFAKYSSALNKDASADYGLARAAGSRGSAGLLPWLWMPSIWAVLAFALILGGIVPRLLEYQPD